MPTSLVYTLAVIAGYRAALLFAELSLWNIGPLVVVFCLDTIAFGVLGMASLARARREHAAGRLGRARPLHPALLGWMAMCSASLLWLVGQAAVAISGGTIVLFPSLGAFNWVVVGLAFAARFGVEGWAERQSSPPVQLYADARATAHTLLRMAVPWAPVVFMLALAFATAAVSPDAASPNPVLFGALTSLSASLPVSLMILSAGVELLVAWLRQRPRSSSS